MPDEATLTIRDKLVRRDKALVKLAEFLTDSARVTEASVGLMIGADAKAKADDFFTLRQSLGIEGYRSSGEAYMRIREALDV